MSCHVMFCVRCDTRENEMCQGKEIQVRFQGNNVALACIVQFSLCTKN